MLLPGGHDLPEDSKFSDVISVVVSHDQDFAEDSLICRVRDRGIQVCIWIGHNISKCLYIREK